MEQTRPLLIPQYFHAFSCIGSACEDSCCIGWRVDIDEQTYTKYKDSQDEELKELFSSHVKKNETNSSANTFASIQMQDRGRCVFLSEENLCRVQLRLGEELLSNTCAVYPRTINRVNGVVEKSLTTSCPEAARLALLNPDGIEFDQTEEWEHTPGFIVKDIHIDDPKHEGQPIQHFWNLRIFTIEVLQNRAYSFSERLLLVGRFLREIEEGTRDPIPAIITRYKDMLMRGDKPDLLHASAQLEAQIQICKELIDYRAAQGIGSERYIQLLCEVLDGIKYTSTSAIEDIAERYKEAIATYFTPFMQEHEYILENYAVNYVFMYLFPFRNETIWKDYIMLIVLCSLIQFHLIGIAGFRNGLTPNTAAALIQAFSKGFEHDTVFLQKAFDVLEEQGYTKMEQVATLIKC